ncbi:MAG: SLBB domain-containing protein, partial [Gammaproteobacteria bacterium]|nr:SLBB domain-containing protein [Gammaproteobacteria bacterium]
MKRFYFAWFMALFLIVLNQPAHAAMGVDISVLNSMTPAERQKALSLLGTASMPTQIGRQNNSSNLNQVPVDAGDQLGNALVSETDTALKPKDTIIVFFLDGEQAKLWDKEKSTAILDRSKWETFTTHLRQRGASVFIPKQMQQLYQLDEQGVLHIPSLQSFPLAGLNVEDAAARLNVDPMLQDYQIRIKQLPVKPLGLDAIKPFGYEIFQHSARAQMDPEWNVPVPASYVLGPGDVVHVQLFGKENQEYYLEVSRDGNIAFPGVGSVPVAGISFKELKEDIKSRIKKQFIGVAANVSLGELRSIHVFVLGDVKNPGSYIVSGLSSITHALLKAGGISESGSLRNIELKRNGRAEKKLDLYELLLNGSTRNDARLEAGDVVYVPPIQHTVSVIGEVNRPAIYELKNGETVAELIRLAGGTTNTAYRKEARIERTESDTQRHVLNVDLDKDKENSIKVKNGDVVT